LDKDVYHIRDKIVSTLSIPDSLFGAFRNHFSVAVTDDKDIAVDESVTILSSLLLSSEIKGYIENPAYYLQDNPASNAALDLLMMTHGWRRYNIPEVVKGNPEYPLIPFQMFQEISGQVKSPILSRPVVGSEIIVTIKDRDSDVWVTLTDESGYYIVKNLEFPDNTTFYMLAVNKRESDNVVLVVDNESFPKPVHAPQSPFSRQKIKDAEIKDEPGIDAFMEKAEQRAKFEEDIWAIQLKEIEITASRIQRNEPRLQFWANQISDATITREQIEKNKRVYVSDYLAYTSDVLVFPDGRIRIRGGTGNPVIFIDGVEQDWPESLNHPSQSPLERIAISAIESIDIFKGFATTAFGVRGANGVISVTIRKGANSPFTKKMNQVIYNPLGYQQPAEFYSSNYETLEARQSAIPDYRTTIFWKPDLVITDENEKATFEFYTSDFRTTYSVVIEGITADGRIVRQVEKIVVND